MSNKKTDLKIYDVSATEAKKDFGYSSQRLGQYCAVGIITRSKPGRVWMYSRYELECLKEFFKQRDIEDWANALAQRFKEQCPPVVKKSESDCVKQECCKQERKDDGIVVAVDEPIEKQAQRIETRNASGGLIWDEEVTEKKKRRWGRKGK